MSASARRTRAGFWLAGTLVFSGVFVALFRFIPYSYAVAEPFYKPPVPLPSGKICLRSDSMGEGHFGASRNNNRTHAGIDLAAPLNEPVFAAKSGRVAFAAHSGGYGKYVRILHPDGRDSRYAHLSEIDVSRGQWVKRGQIIGRVGKTGNAASGHIQPHLHFEIRRNDTPLNPVDCIIQEGRETA